MMKKAIYVLFLSFIFDGCKSEPNCDDGIYCNGIERYIKGRCVKGVPPSCDDGIFCTLDRCDLKKDRCVHEPNHSLCNDDIFCNGKELCDLERGCVSGQIPSCDDGVDCTSDRCDLGKDRCVHESRDDLCDDGIFCNGKELCDLERGCISGQVPSCDDGVDCTLDRCDLGKDRCVYESRHDLCDDGLFCNGKELCDLERGCVSGPLVSCNDGLDCTRDVCDEVLGSCLFIPDDGLCDDGNVCNGKERCILGQGCILGEPPPDGTPCQAPVSGSAEGPSHICLGQECVESRCGDGCRVLPEDCDDGGVDLGEADGCTLECRSIDFLVSLGKGGDLFSSVLAISGSSLFVVWEERNDSGRVIWGRLFSLDGIIPLGEEFMVSDLGYSFFPRVVSFSGGFVVVWLGRDSDGYGVYARLLGEAGDFRGSGFRVNVREDFSQLVPSVSVHSGGDWFIVVWEDVFDIWARRFDLSGRALDSEEFLVSGSGSSFFHQPGVAVSDQGEVFVVWEEVAFDSARILGRRYIEGESLPVEVLVESSQVGVFQPQVIFSQGDFIIAWVEANDLGYLVKARLYNAGFEFLVFEGVQPEVPRFSLFGLGGAVLDLDWGFIFVWEDFTNRFGDSSGRGILARRFLSSGQAIESVFLVNTVSFMDQSNPFVALGSDGTIAVTWEDSSRISPGEASPKIAARVLPPWYTKEER